MEIKIKQSKLMEILDYLYIDGIFPSSIITTKDGSLFSVQHDEDNFCFRYEQFYPEYFENISKEQESVRIDVQKVKGFASLRKADDIITLQFPSPQSENKLLISSKRARNNIAVTKIDADDVSTSLPFMLKEKVPYINKGQTPLDTHASISLGSLKTLKEYASKHSSDYYRFKIDANRKFEIIVGDINEHEDFTSFEPNAQVCTVNEDLDVTFTKGIKELAKTFTGDVDVYMRTNMPAWFTEVSQKHKFGLFISPMRSE